MKRYMDIDEERYGQKGREIQIEMQKNMDRCVEIWIEMKRDMNRSEERFGQRCREYGLRCGEIWIEFIDSNIRH